MPTRRSALNLPIVLLFAGLVACAAAGEQVVQGECRSAFDADICTFATMAGDQVVNFGATIPLATAENAPAEGEMVFPPPDVAIVPLPAEVRSATGFDHLGVNWEPHGHPPGLFMTPHFDFHFYTISSEQVDAIDCVDPIKPTNIPAGYALPDLEIPGIGTLVGVCVPQMGMHAMLESELDQTEPFGASMIVGYDQQDAIFVEPMIAQAKLLAAQSFTLDVPSVPDASAGVRWPTHFEAVYDEAERQYRFVFSGMGR